MNLTCSVANHISTQDTIRCQRWRPFHFEMVRSGFHHREASDHRGISLWSAEADGVTKYTSLASISDQDSSCDGWIWPKFMCVGCDWSTATCSGCSHFHCWTRIPLPDDDLMDTLIIWVTGSPEMNLWEDSMRVTFSVKQEVLYRQKGLWDNIPHIPWRSLW